MPMEQSSSMGRVLFSWFSGEYKGTEVQVSSRKEKEKKRINLFLITEGQHVGTYVHTAVNCPDTTGRKH